MAVSSGARYLPFAGALLECVWRRSEFASGGSARDETYLYWTRSAPRFATIERMRLDTP